MQQMLSVTALNLFQKITESALGLATDSTGVDNPVTLTLLILVLTLRDR